MADAGADAWRSQPSAVPPRSPGSARSGRCPTDGRTDGRKRPRLRAPCRPGRALPRARCPPAVAAAMAEPGRPQRKLSRVGESLYRVLGLEKGSSPEEIKRAYRYGGRGAGRAVP